MTYIFQKATLILGIFFLASCAGGDRQKGDSDSVKTVQPEKKSSVAVQFNDSKQAEIYEAYEGLKNELVASNFESSKNAAKVLATKLEGYQGCELTAKTAQVIAQAKDIKEQRSSFTTLSNDVIALFKHADVKSGTIFVQHCPMANGGDGGDWLSSEKKVQNPYYGDEMMECGAVVEEIKSK